MALPEISKQEIIIGMRQEMEMHEILAKNSTWNISQAILTTSKVWRIIYPFKVILLQY